MRQMSILIPVYVFLFGAALGSFVGLATVRIPLGESVLAPRSHCRSCRRTLPWYENIPLFSYLFLRGKCRGCHVKISPRYFWIEAATAALTLAAYYRFQPWPRFLLYVMCLIIPLLILMIIDWERLLLPDILTVPGIGLGFLVHWADGMYFRPYSWGASHLKLLLDSGAGVLAGGATLFLLGEIYRRMRNREGMGGGDIKMAAMLGAFFGWKAIFFIFFLASIVGVALGLVLILFRGQSKEVPLPFGSCLGLAALGYLFCGEWLLRHYLHLLHRVL
jgi:leader peptidase (prepilin peptidase)/N-methyltransferase